MVGVWRLQVVGAAVLLTVVCALRVGPGAATNDGGAAALIIPCATSHATCGGQQCYMRRPAMLLAMNCDAAYLDSSAGSRSNLLQAAVSGAMNGE
jgi:hypothetical protein